MPGEKAVQQYGKPEEHSVLVRLPQPPGVEEGFSLEKDAKALNDAVKAANLGPFQEISREVVGPAIGKDLQRKGLWATLFSILGITAYIALRFRLTFAIGAIAATFHDILVTLAFLVFFGYDLSLNVIAALLTITGYSVNDTIVIFDRVRENMHTMRRDDLEKVVNQSVNQTLGRTLITAGTTFLSVLALYLFGGEVLEGFAFTMLVGIISGTYSTIFIAAAVAILMSKRAAGTPAGAAADRGAGGRHGPSGRRQEDVDADDAQGQRPLVPGPPTFSIQARGRAGHMSILIAALLGAVQGITEFLPVSSSAHLLLGRAAFGWGEEPFGLVFDVATHLGTLVATIIYFRDDLMAMALALPRLFTDAPEARLMRLVAIGTIPVVIVGLLFADWIEAHARLPVVTIVTLSVGAIGLLLVERLGPRTRGVDDLTPVDATAFGLAQAAALIPGLSRSGSTITDRACSSASGATPRPGSRSCSASRRWWRRRGRPASRCATCRCRASWRRSSPSASCRPASSATWPSASCCATSRRTASTSSPTTAWPWPRWCGGSCTDQGTCRDRRTAPIVRDRASSSRSRSSSASPRSTGSSTWWTA